MLYISIHKPYSYRLNHISNDTVATKDYFVTRFKNDKRKQKYGFTTTEIFSEGSLVIVNNVHLVLCLSGVYILNPHCFVT